MQADTTLEICRENFYLNHLIGKGAYAHVFQAEEKVSKQFFAIKRTSKALILFKNSVENILREKEHMMDLNSEFIVKMLHTFQNNDYLYIVQEYMPHGDLRFQMNRNKNFTESQTSKNCREK